MKKMFFFLLTVIFCFSIASADEIKVKGGSSQTSATFIDSTKYGIAYETSANANTDTWFKIVAPTDGEYSIRACKIGSEHNYVGIVVYTQSGKKVINSALKEGLWNLYAYKAKRGETLYLGFEMSTYGEAIKSAQFSVCFDGFHSTEVIKDKVLSPSCTKDGAEYYNCLLCEKKAYEVSIPLLNHSPGDTEISTTSTCILQGESVVRCTRCNAVLSSEVLPLTGHTIGTMQPVKSPTCTTPGLNVQQCTVCFTTLATETPAALGHTPGSVETTTSTCLVEGAKVVHCSVCNEILSSEPIAKSEHIPAPWVDLRKATCTADGQRVQYCAVCNATLATETVPAFGHSPMDWQTTREAACLQSGLKEKKCSACGLALESEQINALGHIYTEWEILTEATKEQEGEKRRHCINYGDTKYEVIPKVEKFLGIF